MLALWLSGCGGDGQPTRPTPIVTEPTGPIRALTGLYIVRDEGFPIAQIPRVDEVIVNLGDQVLLTAIGVCDDGEPHPVGRDSPCFTAADRPTWASADPEIASVALARSEGYDHDVAGLVTGHLSGLTMITGTFQGLSTDVQVIVRTETTTGGRARRDRRDDRGGPQIHFVHAVPTDRLDTGYHPTVVITHTAAVMQRWLEHEAGTGWRLDTFNGQLDVSFLPVEMGTLSDGTAILHRVEDALERREGGQLRPDKKYAVFLEYGEYLQIPGGIASSKVGLTFLNGPGFVPLYGWLAGHAIHEVIHTFGAVARCAPNLEGFAHVDSPNDIMNRGSGEAVIGRILDVDRDDYFGHDNPGCLDIADVPYWEGPTNAGTATAGARGR